MSQDHDPVSIQKNMRDKSTDYVCSCGFKYKTLKNDDPQCPIERTNSQLEKILDAWNDPGRSPAYHRQMQRNLKQDWPVLYRAIENLVNDKRGRQAYGARDASTLRKV